MRDFSKVSPRIWRDRTFQMLPDSDAKLVAIYLMTNEHQNSAGCYRLPEGYAVSDLGWDRGRFQAAFTSVLAAHFAHFDETTEEIFVSEWFRDNPPMNAKHSLGINKMLSRVESERVRQLAQAEFEAAEDRRTHVPATEKKAEILNITDNLLNTRYMQRARAAR